MIVRTDLSRRSFNIGPVSGLIALDSDSDDHGGGCGTS